MIAPTNKKAPPKRGGGSKIAIWGIVAVAVVAVAIALVMLPNSNDESNPDKATKRGRIATVSPNIKATSQMGVEEAEHAPETPMVVEEPKTNQWGNPAHWGHKKLRPSNYIRHDPDTLPLEERIFNTMADKSIAGLLVIEPGDDLIGSDEFDERFVKSFLHSIEHPIIIAKDDTDEERMLKRAVIDTRIELKARYDAGEDIAKIMTETRRELRELGAYREDLKKELENLRKDKTMTVEEMKAYVEAANVMLRERGAKEIVMPEFYYRQLEFRNQKHKELEGE